MVQRSRSFGFAETVSNTLQFAWLASGWHVAGVRWIANRDVCSGYINSGNALVGDFVRRALKHNFPVRAVIF
jgi:hypothetical protein